MEQITKVTTYTQVKPTGPCLRVTLAVVMLACSLWIRLAASTAPAWIPRLVCAQLLIYVLISCYQVQGHQMTHIL